MLYASRLRHVDDMTRTALAWFGPRLPAPPAVRETGPLLDIVSPLPLLRPEGTVLGAAHHTARQAHMDARLHASLAEPATAVSAWVNHYQPGDFVALHQDRPDAHLTALLALDPANDPTVLCYDYRAFSGPELLALANHEPHPPGQRLLLEDRRFLFLRGTALPHHRPPVASVYRVLAVTLTVPEE